VTTSPPSLFYGWKVVAAAFIVLFTAYGAQYSFGVFFNALLQEFHWSRASLSGVFSLYAFGYSVFGFPAGRLTDAWGPTGSSRAARCSSAPPWRAWRW
jgi:MFS family permease